MSNTAKKRPLLEALEPRLLYSADLFGAGHDSPHGDDPLAALLDTADIGAALPVVEANGQPAPLELEYHTGAIENGIAISKAAQARYDGVLDIATGLVGRWTFDADASDATIPAYNGVLSGNAAIDNVAPPFGAGSLALDGNGDYVELSASRADIGALTQGTLAAWIRTSDATNTQSILAIADNRDNISYSAIGIYQGGFFFDVAEADTYLLQVADNTNIADGAWHHVAVTIDASGNTFYVDGVTTTNLTYYDGSASTSAFLSDVTQATSLQIGIADGKNGLEWDFNGGLDDVRVYDRALSAADIATLADKPPTALDNIVPIHENGAHVLAASDFNYADADGDAFAGVRVTTVENAGALTLDGVDVTQNQFITRADIDAGQLVFTPASNVSGDGYASFGFKVNDGQVDSETSHSITFDVKSLPANTLTWTPGANGYNAVLDTDIDNANPGVDNGAATEIEVDLDDGAGDGTLQGLLRFDNLLGSGPNQIPLGARIDSASLTLNVTNISDAGATIELHNMRQNWNETSNWNDFGGGIDLNNSEAESQLAAAVSVTDASGQITITGLATSVQSWANGNAALGWMFNTDNPNGWRFSSSESPVVALRPTLTVSYSSDRAPDHISLNESVAVTVNNPGFEADPAANDDVTGANGWSTSGPVGSWNPSATWYTFEAPEGQNIGFIDSDTGGASLSQTLGDTFEAGRSYTLSAMVGNENAALDSSGWQLRLYAGNQLLGAVSNTDFDPTNGEFIRATLHLDAATLSSHATNYGDALRIELFNQGDPATVGNAHFDDVRLEYTQINIQDDVANGTQVASVGDVSDPNSGDTATFSLADDAGGRFAINPVSGMITVADGSRLNHATAASHDIVVRATDGSGRFHDETFTIELSAAPRVLSGSVYEDLDANAFLDASDTPAAGVSMSVYRDDGIQVGRPDSTDSLVATTITDGNGYYRFGGLEQTRYWVVADSRSVAPSAGFNTGFAQGDIWAEQTWGGYGATFLDSSGGYQPLLSNANPLYGGLNENRSDDASTLSSAEHLNYVDLSSADRANVDYGFSFSVVTDSRDGDDDAAANRTLQGSLRQAIQNGNALIGDQSVAFHLPVDDSNHFYYQDDGIAAQVSVANIVATSTSDANIGDLDPDHASSWFRIQPSSALPIVTDPLILSAESQSGYIGKPVIELNGTNAGAGVTGLRISAADSQLRGFAITGFDDNGIIVTGDGNRIQNNHVGTDVAGRIDQGNTGSGIRIEGISNQITDNLASGNGIDGIRIAAGNNTVQGNITGANIDGTGAIPNDDDGIDVRGNDNLIGGPTAGQGNLISGNANDGIYSQNAAGNRYQGNLIGLTLTGDAALANLDDGLQFGTGANGNLIGGTTTGERNIISGNTGDGILLSGSGAVENWIHGNFIGTDITGSLAIGNDNGIQIKNDADDNTIGGATTGDANLISGNRRSGVLIADITTNGSQVLGNIIGVDASGNSALGNNEYGVRISDSPNHSIIGNQIAANGKSGVLLSLAGSTGNTLQGNRIGTNAAGTAAIANSTAGIQLSQGASNNLIGGSAAGEGNLISGNGWGGIEFDDDSTSGNRVLGNRIGTDASGRAPLGNNAFGIGLWQGPHDNIIGGALPGEANLISANAHSGIYLSNIDPNSAQATRNNIIQGNKIGTDIDGANPNGDMGNQLNGIEVTQGANNNLIGGTLSGQGNLIMNNSTGVAITDGGSGNAVLGNQISANSSLGIDLGDDGVTANDTGDADSGPNKLQNMPLLYTATAAGVDLRITGTLNSTANTNYRIEFFRNPAGKEDSSGHGEGAVYLGATTVTTDTAGSASIAVNLSGANPLAGDRITATATVDLGAGAYGDTSEFALNGIAVAPGISVSPTSGLTTSEAGGTANIDFILDAAPLSDVTIALSVDQVTEASLSTPSLTFTPTNWNQTQSVTLTGLQDDTNDGDTAYKLITAVANSKDSAYDGMAVADVALINLAVANSAPGITSLVTQSVAEDSTLTFSSASGNAILISDADAGDNPIQISLGANDGTLTLSGSTGLSFSSGDGSADASMTFSGKISDINTALEGLAYTPSTDFNGSTAINIAANDQANTGTGGAQTGNSSIAIAVTSVNDEQTLDTNAGLTLSEGGGVIIDNSVLGASDIDNSTAQLIYSVTTPPASGRLELSGNPGVAIASFTQDDIDNNRLIYQHDGSETTTDSFAFSVDDGAGAVSSGTFAISIIAVNAPPLITSAGSAIVAENQTGVLTVTASDADSNIPTFSITGGADAGLFAIDANAGALTLMAAPDFEHPSDANNDGVYEVQVSADDGNGGSDTQLISVSITDVNEAPGFTSTAITTATQGGAYTYNITTTDPDGNPLTISATTLPAWLGFSDNGDGSATLSGTLTNAEVGNHSVVLAVSDGALSDIQSFTLTVDAGNSPPMFSSIAPTSATVDHAYSYSISGSDPNGDPLTIAASGLPAWLSLTDNGDGSATLSGTPAAGDAGTSNIILRLSDGIASDTQNFVLNVGGPNGAPVFNSFAPRVITTGQHYQYHIVASDPEGDALGISASALPGWLSLTDNGDGTATLAGTPGLNDNGNYPINLLASDGVDSVSQQFTLSVAEINHAPSFVSRPEGDAIEEQRYHYQVFARDLDGDSLRFSAIQLPSWLTLTPSGPDSAILSGTPDDPEVGTHRIVLGVSDGSLSAQLRFQITVENVNDAPLIRSDTQEPGVVEDQRIQDGRLVTSGGLHISDADPGESFFVAETLNGTLGQLRIDRDGGWEYTADAGQAAIQQLAAGESLAEHFQLTTADGSHFGLTLRVHGSEDAPRVGTPIADQTATQNSAFQLRLPADSFSDIDRSDILHYAATRVDGGALPAWLRFDPASRTLSGTPAFTDAGQLAIRINADDGLESAAQEFMLNVKALPIPDEPFSGNGDPQHDSGKPVARGIDSDTQPAVTGTGSSGSAVAEPITPVSDTRADGGRLVIGDAIDASSSHAEFLPPRLLAETPEPAFDPTFFDPYPLDADTLVELFANPTTTTGPRSNPVIEAIPPKPLNLGHLDLNPLAMAPPRPPASPSHTALHNPDFLADLDLLKQDLDQALSDDTNHRALKAETVIGLTMSLSVGVVSWVTRAGSLMAAFMSIAPLWKQLDPLLVLGTDPKRTSPNDESDDDNISKRVESLFEGAEPPPRKD